MEFCEFCEEPYNESKTEECFLCQCMREGRKSPESTTFREATKRKQGDIAKAIMKDGCETIKELLILIESSEAESLKMSNDYLYNVLSRIKNVTIPAAYSAGKEA